jgi:hypothetical protein
MVLHLTSSTIIRSVSIDYHIKNTFFITYLIKFEFSKIQMGAKFSGSAFM